MQGRVTYVNEKPWNGKVLYSFKLANDEALYMCGNTKPNITKNDFIEFDAQTNPKGQTIVDTKTIRKKEAQVVQAKEAGRDAYWSKREQSDDTRQNKIEWQAARNSAIAAADLILKNGALKMPAKEAAKYDAVLALVGELTQMFYDQTKTQSTSAVPAAAAEVVPETEVHTDGQDDGWDE